MTPDSDVCPAHQSHPYSAAPPALSAPLASEPAAGDLFQEINERRARIENAELLRRLRGL